MRAEQRQTDRPPQEAAAPKPMVGAEVVGSQLKEADYIKLAGGSGLHVLVTKAEPITGRKHALRFKVVGQPSAGKEIGDEFGGEWTDEGTKSGKWVLADPLEPSPVASPP